MKEQLWKKDCESKIAEQRVWKKNWEGSIVKERLWTKNCKGYIVRESVKKILKEDFERKFLERRIVKEWL